MLELAHAGKVAEVVRGDRDRRRIAFEDLAQRLAGQPRDLALQRADAGFAGVVADQVAQAPFGELELALLEAVGLDLLGDQVALGDLDQTVEVTSNDEIKDLVVTVNRMTDNLRTTAGLVGRVAQGDITVEPKPLSDKEVDIVFRWLKVRCATFAGYLLD